jgi:hypothetical protein
MKRLLVYVISILSSTVLLAQNSPLRYDAIMGISQSTGALNFENKLGGRIGGGVRYILNNYSSINMLQVDYDFFHNTSKTSPMPQLENAGGTKNLSFMTGYTHQLFNLATSDGNIKMYLGANLGIGVIGHNETDRVTKFGMNPVLSIEPFREVFADFGYHNYWGGIRNTSYYNFSLRFSFHR